MSGDHEFDVFLAHHSADKPFVLEISTKLKQHELKPWVDEEQIAPGQSFQQEIQQAIPTVKTAAIILGINGVGRWQEWEIQTFFYQCVKRGTRVIPVLLPGVDEVPENLPFLQQLRWINFSSPNDTTALKLLIWGITGKRPQEDLKDDSPSTTSTETIRPNSFDADIHFNQTKAQSYQRFKVDVLYKITSKTTNKVLAISSGSTNRGARLIQWEWLNNDEQKFQIFRLEGEQEYSLRVKHSRQCLAVPDRSMDRGVALIQWECNSYAEQQFEIIPYSEYYALKAKHSGMVMTVPRNDEKNDGKVCQYPQFSADFSDDQLFRIEEVESYSHTDQNNSDDSSKFTSDANYSKLEDFLKSGYWKEADQATTEIMLKIAKVRNKSDLDEKLLETLPISDLLHIDKLWRRYSNQKFGFSVQKEIFHEASKDIKDFAERVGWKYKTVFKDYFSWKEQRNITFELNLAPSGHLPWSWANLRNHSLDIKFVGDFEVATDGSKKRIETLFSRRGLKSN